MTQYEIVNFDGTMMTQGSLQDCFKWLVAEFPSQTVETVFKNFRIQPVS